MDPLAPSPPNEYSAVLAADLTKPEKTWSVDARVIALWLAVQICCLALALLHVPLAAAYPPGERLAVELLLAGQIGSMSLLAPALTRSVGTMLVAAMSIGPGLLLAGALEPRPIGATVQAAAIAMAWLVTLWLWCRALLFFGLRELVSPIAALIAIGGPLLSYLVAEFGPGAGESAERSSPIIHMTPLLLAWDIADSSSGTAATFSISGMLALLAMFLGGLMLAAVTRRLKSRLANREREESEGVIGLR